MEELKKLVKQYPNDMELGEAVRKMVMENTKISTSKKNVVVDDWYLREHTD
jgi:outer membrane protein assembly factor BamD (BamD/ComL family)